MGMQRPEGKTGVWTNFTAEPGRKADPFTDVYAEPGVIDEEIPLYGRGR